MDSRSLLPIGTKLQMGRYRVDRYLSSGSFGNTYVITNLQFGEQYAMKEFFMKGVNEREKNHTTICVSNKVNFERYEQQREKFKKEARRMSQLSNKHLVKVYDLFDENGTTYYVMDLIHGQTMQDAMEETGRTYTEAQAINVIYQILEALDTLHQKGIWHLDLKPANIMINDQGLVKVIDFGASKQMNANLEYTSTSAAICYTPGFAPTEQVDQNISRIGPWTDLYALGATLYYMLTGSQPPSSSEILDGYAFQFRFPVSNEIQQLIIWMMKPNRKDRPQSVAEVRDYLDKIQKSAPAVEKNGIKEEPVMQNFADNEGDSPKNTNKFGIALGVICGLIIIIAIGVNYRNNNQSTNPESYSIYSHSNDSLAIIEEEYDALVDTVAVDSAVASDYEDPYTEKKDLSKKDINRIFSPTPKDAKKQAADAKEKAAERAKAEAEQAAEAAKHAAERAKAEAEQGKADAAKLQKSKTSNVASARQDVIAILGKATKFPKAIDREKLREVAINKLYNLISMDSAHKSVYIWCITELKKPITLTDNGRGQYTVCIYKLKALTDNNSSRDNHHNKGNNKNEESKDNGKKENKGELM